MATTAIPATAVSNAPIAIRVPRRLADASRPGADTDAVESWVGTTSSVRGTEVPVSALGSSPGDAAGEHCHVGASDVVNRVVMDWLEAALGLEFDADHGEIRLRNPRLPAFLNEVILRDLKLGASSADLRLRRHGDEVSLEVMKTRGKIQVSIVLSR